MTPGLALDVLSRKLAARSRRSRALRETARISAAPIEAILAGGDLDRLIARAAPGWPSGSDVAAFGKISPDDAGQEADSVLSGEIRLFGRLHRVAKDDGRIDWSYAPRDPEFAPFRTDVKFPWEVARLAALPRLGAGFASTGDDRYAAGAAKIVDDWCASQRVGEGIHFTSALEVGIRLIALGQAFHFFRGSSAFPRNVVERLVRHIAASAAWLDGHLSTDRVVAGNHLLGELAGAIVTDLWFPELGGRGRLARNLPLFAREVESQIAPDGVSLEQSTTYGRFVADFIAIVLSTSRGTGTGVPPGLVERGAALAGWLAAVTRPDGTLPLVGDNDNGRGVDWGETTPSNDARRVVRILAGLGDAPARRPPPQRHLSLFPAGGHAVYHNPDTGDYIFVRCGPFGHGLPKPSAHSHADWMAPVVILGGHEILVDPGNYGYTSVGDDRNAFRVDAAHSTFTVGGAAMAVPGAPFRWNTVPEPAVFKAGEDPDVIRWTGRWKPAGSKSNRLACVRTLVYNKRQRLMTFEDEWDGVAETSGSTVVWRWRLPADARVEAGDDRFRVVLSDRASFLFELDPAATASVAVGSIAPRYGEKVPAPIVIVERPTGPGKGRQITRLSIEQGAEAISK